MKLQDRLPEHITIGRKRYRVDLDFRNVLRMMEELARNDLLPAARDWRALHCVMRRPPRDTQAALAAIRAICFPAADTPPDGKKVTSFEQDADLIRAAFRQTYRIDLWRDRLHWIEFSALLAGLPEGSRYSEIIGIRARPMPKATKYNAEERKWLSEAKARYAIRMTEDEVRASYDRGVLDVFHALLGMAKKQAQETKEVK